MGYPTRKGKRRLILNTRPYSNPTRPNACHGNNGGLADTSTSITPKIEDLPIKGLVVVYRYIQLRCAKLAVPSF